MPTARCPRCDETFPVAPDVGRVDCPVCGMRFESTWDEREPAPKPSRRELDVRMASALEPGTLATLVRGGTLQACATALLLVALTILVAMLARQLDPPTPRGGPEKWTRVLIPLLGLALMASWFLGVLAAACWAMAPVRGVSRALGVAVLCFSVPAIWRGATFLFLLLRSVVSPGAAAVESVELRSGWALAEVFCLEMFHAITLACYLAAAANDTKRKGGAIVLPFAVPLLLLGPIFLTLLLAAADMLGPDMGTVVSLLVLLGNVAAALCTLVVVLLLRGSWARMARTAAPE